MAGTSQWVQERTIFRVTYSWSRDKTHPREEPTAQVVSRREGTLHMVSKASLEARPGTHCRVQEGKRVHREDLRTKCLPASFPHGKIPQRGPWNIPDVQLPRWEER